MNQGTAHRDIAERLAMSESDLYRKQRLAIDEVARTLATMEQKVAANGNGANENLDKSAEKQRVNRERIALRPHSDACVREPSVPRR